jgi:hypothetical protein
VTLRTGWTLSSLTRPLSVLRLWLVLAACALAAPHSFAQSPAAETVQQRITGPALRAPATPLPTGTQSMGEIKIVQEYPKPATLTFVVSQEYFYNDNVAYTHQGQQGSQAYGGSYTASYVPYSLRDWTPRIAVQYNMFRYDSFSSQDFDNEQIFANSTYAFGTGRDWSWIAGVDASRYTTPHADDHEFYREMIYENQVRRVISLSSDVALYLLVGYDIAYHQASPSAFDYLSNGIGCSLIYNPIPELTISPYINPALRSFLTNTYFQHDRDDAHLAEGLDVIWQPWKYLALDASIYHVNDYSNNSGLSFNYSLPGVTLSGAFEF